MYAWEGPFARRIGEIRIQERGILRYAAYIQSTLASLVPVAPVVAGALTFSLTVSTGNDLTAANAFTTLTLFNLMRFSLSTVPRGVRVSCRCLFFSSLFAGKITLPVQNCCVARRLFFFFPGAVGSACGRQSLDGVPHVGKSPAALPSTEAAGPVRRIAGLHLLLDHACAPNAGRWWV